MTWWTYGIVSYVVIFCWFLLSSHIAHRWTAKQEYKRSHSDLIKRDSIQALILTTILVVLYFFDITFPFIK